MSDIVEGDEEDEELSRANSNAVNEQKREERLERYTDRIVGMEKQISESRQR